MRALLDLDDAFEHAYARARRIGVDREHRALRRHDEVVGRDAKALARDNVSDFEPDGAAMESQLSVAGLEALDGEVGAASADQAIAGRQREAELVDRGTIAGGKHDDRRGGGEPGDRDRPANRRARARLHRGETERSIDEPASLPILDRGRLGTGCDLRELVGETGHDSSFGWIQRARYGSLSSMRAISRRA